MQYKLAFILYAFDNDPEVALSPKIIGGVIASKLKGF